MQTPPQELIVVKLGAQFKTGIVPQHDEAEAEDSHYAQYGGGGATSELRQEGIGEDEEDKTGYGEMETATCPQVVLEHTLTGERAGQAEQLQHTSCSERERERERVS